MSEDKKVFSFNVSEIPDETAYTVIPAGTYEAMITNAEMKQPKDQNKAEYLNIEYSVEVGDKLQKVWESLVINYGDDTTAQNIARSRMKSIGVACGLDLLGFTNPEQLKDRSLKLVLAVKKSAEYGEQNVVKKVLPLFEEEEESEPKKSDDNIPNYNL